MAVPSDDWNPGAYGRFRGLRLRPALDLLAQVGDLPPGPVVDLGCGTGVAGPALAARFAGRTVLGLDASPAMLAEAGATGAYARLVEADIADWQPQDPPALIFSNAALHWLGDHDRLMPRLAGALAPGGVLAVQMPGQGDAPSHRLAREVAARLWGAAPAAVRVEDPAWYARRLAPLGAVEAWETTYLQPLSPAAEGHPVRLFTQSTLLRPILAGRDAAETAAFLRAYDAALADAYPPEPDGPVLFPFRRVFFTLRRA